MYVRVGGRSEGGEGSKCGIKSMIQNGFCKGREGRREEKGWAGERRQRLSGQLGAGRFRCAEPEDHLHTKKHQMHRIKLQRVHQREKQKEQTGRGAYARDAHTVRTCGQMHIPVNAVNKLSETKGFFSENA